VTARIRRGAVRAAAVLALAAALPAIAEPLVLRHGTAADPPSLDPNVAAGSLAAPILADMFAGLVVRDAESRPEPGSAQSWTVSDDGLTYTFRLRPDLRWSDGAPLTAEDFVYSFRRLMTSSTGSLLSGLFFFLKGGESVYRNQAPVESLGVTAPDPRTLVFVLEHPVPYFLQLLANVQVAPVPRHAIERHGRDWTRADRMVSNGAYRIVERVPQSYIKLVKNPNFYAASSVRIDEVYWYPTQDLATSLRRFRAGELDIVLNFPPDEIDWLRANMPEALRITPSLASYFLVVNTRRVPFDDARVRRALSLAIDRETITGKLLRTGVKPAWSFASPDFEGYGGITLAEQGKPLAERQAEARRLLLLAGFGPGKPLTVPLLYDTQEENRKIMVAVASMWQAIGVRTELTNLEFGALNSRVRSKTYDVARWTYFASFGDAYSFLQLLGTHNPNNWVGWTNAQYDALLDRSNLTRDPAERAAILREAETLMMKESPVIPIYYYVGRRLVSPRVKGWIDTPRGTTPTRFLTVER
jgi:oligopeptide transport system substrate-binding protein